MSCRDRPRRSSVVLGKHRRLELAVCADDIFWVVQVIDGVVGWWWRSRRGRSCDTLTPDSDSAASGLYRWWWCFCRRFLHIAAVGTLKRIATQRRARGWNNVCIRDGRWCFGHDKENASYEFYRILRVRWFEYDDESGEKTKSIGDGKKVALEWGFDEGNDNYSDHDYLCYLDMRLKREIPCHTDCHTKVIAKGFAVWHIRTGSSTQTPESLLTYYRN